MAKILLQLSIWTGPAVNHPRPWTPTERQESWVSDEDTVAGALDRLEEYRQLFAILYNPDRRGTALVFRLLGVQTIDIDQVRADAVGVASVEDRLAALKQKRAHG